MLADSKIFIVFFVTLASISFSSIGNGLTNNYYATIILSIFCLFSFYINRLIVFKYFNKKISLLILLLIASFFVSCVIADKNNQFVWYRFYSIISCIAFGFFTYIYLCNKKINILDLTIIMAMIGLMHVIALSLFWFNLEMPTEYQWMMGIPFFNHIRNFTDYMGICALSSLFLVFFTSKYSQIFWLVISVLIFSVIFWSGSRSTLIGLVFSVFFIFLIIDNKLNNFIKFISIVFFSLYISYLFRVLDQGLGFFRSLERSVSGSLNTITSFRLELYEKILNFIFLKPFFGYGGEAVRNHIVDIRGMSLSQAHNFILQIILEFGLVGLTLLLIFIIILFENCDFKKIDNYKLIFISIIIYIFFSSLFNGGFYYTAILSLLCMGISITYFCFKE